LTNKLQKKKKKYVEKFGSFVPFSYLCTKYKQKAYDKKTTFYSFCSISDA